MRHTDYLTLQLEWEANILATFLQATPAQIVDGKRWYPQAISALESIHDVWYPAQRAAVCAVLSPRITWQSNLEGVRRMARASSQGLRVCPGTAMVYPARLGQHWSGLGRGDVFSLASHN